MSIKSLQQGLTTALLIFAFASVATAQQVNSEVRGSVTDENGAPISDAAVVITHVPSGSRRESTTSAGGGFFQTGLRVGGPYTITVSADGYRDALYEEVNLAPGSQRPFEITLETISAEIEELIVTAEAAPIQDLDNAIGSAFAADDIINMPAADRDVIRTLLRDPFAQSNGDTGNLSVAGINPRFNGLAIDGSLQQDDFGLGDSTYATSRSPVNLDAVESASVVAAEYDVGTSNFTGGLVNLTIKSGTNEFSGNAYYDTVQDDYIGDKFDGDQEFDPGSVDDKEYGFTLGGPIIKDRLFFFVSYDEFESAQQEDFRFDDQNDGIEDGFFEALRQVILDSTGYDPGSRPGTASTPQTSERALAKIDWNITDRHRASFTYQDTQEQSTFGVNNTAFEGSWYDAPVDLKAYTVQLYSDWNDALSTTFRANLKEFERGQNCRAGSGVGMIDIDDLTPDDLVGTPLEGLLTGDAVDIDAGCDRFRHANEYNDERLQVLAKADYFVGRHVITGGFEYEDFSLFNKFVPSSLGRFRYFDYDQLAGNTPRVEYTNATSNNSDDAAASWGYEKWSLFVQDSIQLTPTFELSLGLRYETFSQSDTPVFSQQILDTYGIRSDASLDGKDLILPRLSFRWDLGDRTTLTGGLGRFSGGNPQVWVSNAFQTPTVFARVDDYANADPTQVPPELQAEVALGTPVPIDVIAEDFNIPSDWKASLRIEHEFFDGYVATAQYLYTQVEDGFLWRNRAQLDLAGALPTGVAPDGRPIYADLDDLEIDNLTELGNFSDGQNHVFALGLAKRYDNGFNFNFSYAYQDIEAVTEGTSSRGISNWRGIAAIDRNNPDARTSPYQVEHAFKLNLGWEKDFFNTGRSFTRIDLFMQRLSGDAYGHTFNVSGDNALFGRAGNGENPFDNNPLYIPGRAGDANVVYASGFAVDEFLNYVGADDSGRIENMYSRSSAWNTLADLRIQQQIPLFGDNLRAALYLSIDNVLNLLNSDWGVLKTGPGFGQNAVVTADLVTAADVAANGVDGATALLGDAPRTNCATPGACLYRYNSFNDRSINNASASRSVYRVRFGIRIDF
jgi:outer membrane receptor for ferrienterochelin and colicin